MWSVSAIDALVHLTGWSQGTVESKGGGGKVREGDEGVGVTRKLPLMQEGRDETDSAGPDPGARCPCQM